MAKIEDSDNKIEQWFADRPMFTNNTSFATAFEDLEVFIPSKLTFKGPAVSRKQFFYALSILGTSPQLANGRLKACKLITANQFQELGPKFFTREGIITSPLEASGIPTTLENLITKPFGSEFFNAIDKLDIQRMVIWRQAIGISDKIFTIKESWDFKNPSVLIECDENQPPYNMCPPTALAAYLIGPNTRWPIIGMDVTFKMGNTDPTLLEHYRRFVFPRVLNWANGADYFVEPERFPEVTDEKEKSLRLVEVQPGPSPSFYDREGKVTSKYSFFYAMSIFASKPHVINKRVKGAELVVDEIWLCPKFYSIDKSDKTSREIIFPEVPSELMDVFKEPLTKCVINDLIDFKVDRVVLRRRVLGKSLREYTAIEDWDILNCRVVIKYEQYEGVTNEFPPLVFDAYMVDDQQFRIMIGIASKPMPNCDWVLKSLNHYHHSTLPKILKWAVLDDVKSTLSSFIPSSSLKYVPVKTYYEEYERMKNTHFRALKEIWTENTDPLKFIPEEIGIAAYVKAYIESVSEGEPWSFVDMGCGNGVLTYVLSDTGVSGYGFDIRPRKLWSVFHTAGNQPNLKILSFNPFFDAIEERKNQWLIGNHCDELTPWIAVMARKCGAAGFIIIPCCFFDFHGKFQRKSKKEPGDSNSPSRYENYIYYIAEIGKKCGYDIFVDKMRIPSTKRICIIGLDSSSFETAEARQEANHYANSKVIEYPCPDNSIGSIPFQPRSAVERVNNGTQLDKVVVSGIIKTIFKVLLSRTNKIENSMYVKPWNCGTAYKLSVVITSLLQAERNAIKSQGKGLQTILKNFHQIFIIEKGHVRVRCPIVDDRNREGKSINSCKVKTSRCYFNINHPDGCPLTAEKCRFLH